MKGFVEVKKAALFALSITIMMSMLASCGYDAVIRRIKQSGLIDGAYKQVGRLIIVDAEKALELAAKRAKKSNNRNK